MTTNVKSNLTVENQVSSSMITFEDKKVERRLTMKPEPAIGNLCRVTIDDVRIEEHETSKINPETQQESTFEYAGYSIPTLVITFKQIPTNEDPKPRYYEHRFKVVPVINNNGAPIERKSIVGLIKMQFDQLQHIVNSMVGIPGFTDDEAVPGIDIEANVEVRIKQFRAFYTHFLNTIKGDDEKPYYKGVGFYLKLVANYGTRKYLAIPNFVGRGFIERILPKVNPSIALEPNETVVLAKDVSASKTEKAISNGSIPVDNGGIDPEVQKIIDGYN